MWKTCVRSRLSIGNNARTMGGGAGGAAELLFLLLVLIFIVTRVRGFRNRSFMMGNTVQCVMTPGTFGMLTLCVGC